MIRRRDKRSAVRGRLAWRRRPRPGRQAEDGFIVTVELLLIFTIVVLAVLVALAALRNALVDSGLVLRPILVFDSTAPDPLLVGPIFDFDGSETPRVLRRDPNNGATVLLGVRSDRFTSHTPVFYSLDECMGAAFVHDPMSFDATLDPDVELRFGFFDELQGVVYAVGAGGTAGPGSPFGPGLLYRNDPAAMPGAPVVASVYFPTWELTVGGAPGPSPPGSSELNPCRDLADAARFGLVPALEVTDPDTGMNLLEPFVPPFVVN